MTATYETGDRHPVRGRTVDTLRRSLTASRRTVLGGLLAALGTALHISPVPGTNKTKRKRRKNHRCTSRTCPDGCCTSKRGFWMCIPVKYQTSRQCGAGGEICHTACPPARPLLGMWREVAQISCVDGSEISPQERIDELILYVDGGFSVTWFPFETYKDYWGTYTLDAVAGTIQFTIEWGNHIPTDVDPVGGYAFDGAGHLTLTDLWLGTRSPQNGPANCGHRFRDIALPLG